MAKHDRIYIPELGRSFESVAAAAKSLGIDASNINKVLRGKRKSAGGLTFLKNPSADEMETAKKIAVRRPLSETQKVRQQNSKERMKLLDQTHALLVSVNQQQRDKKKAGVLGKDEIFQKIMSHADFFGKNKLGGYDTSLKNLRKFSNDELKNLSDMIINTQKEYADSRNAPRNISSFAYQFGISARDMKNYLHLLPALFQIYRKMQGVDNYDDVKAAIDESMQEGVDPEALESFLLDVDNWYEGGTVTDLDTLLSEFSAEYGSPLSADKNQWDDFGGDFY